VYNRGEGTETSEALEELVGGLEGGSALAFSSGMAAVAALFGGLTVGSILTVPTDPYHGVKGLADEGESQGRWTVRRVDLRDTQAWIEAAADSDLVWLESPANPLMTVADLPQILAAPRKGLAAVDATFAPLAQQPLALGADVVMHAVTKFFGGHSDLMAGVLIAKTDELAHQLSYRRKISGGIIGGMEAFLAVRGMRTLTLRMERASENAQILAERLEKHPHVARVRFPGLAGDENHQTAASFMSGFGSMLSFETTGDGDRATRVCDETRVIIHATSLGGVESTMERRASIPGQETIPPTLIRLSVGCEDVEDLWADLEQALNVP
jgi:cystathionine gamma-synthase